MTGQGFPPVDFGAGAQRVTERVIADPSYGYEEEEQMEQIDWNGSFDFRALCPTCGQPKGKLSEPLEGYTTCPTCKRLSLKIETPETERTEEPGRWDEDPETGYDRYRRVNEVTGCMCAPEDLEAPDFSGLYSAAELDTMPF